MTRKRTRTFWIESWIAAVGGLLAVVTLISQEWIELVFRVDPDHGSGTLEWAVVGGLVALSIASAALARLEWRQTSTLTSQVQS